MSHAPCMVKPGRSCTFIAWFAQYFFTFELFFMQKNNSFSSRPGKTFY